MKYCRRDHEDGCATWQPQGVGSEAYLERYVAGADTRGRQEGRPYPWSQHVIHEISGLEQICQLGILTPKVMERRAIVICSAFFSSEPQPLQS